MGENFGLVAVLVPAGVDDLLDQVGVKQRSQRSQILDRYAQPHRHARHGGEFSATGPDRHRPTGPDALATRTAMNRSKPVEIGVHVLAQSLREVLPRWGFVGLDRRLGEPLDWQALNCARAGVPRPGN